MIEFLKETVLPLNLPFTVLLVLVLLYWLAVILGGIDIDGLDTDWMPDLEADTSGGFFHGMLELLSLGEVPIMLIVTSLIVCGWWFSLISNHFLNPHLSVLIGLGLLLPNLLVSFFLTSALMKPIAKLLASSDRETETQRLLYKIGTVTTSQVNETFGQVEIETGGAPIVIHARTMDGLTLKKGEKALIFDEDKSKGVYFVERYHEE